MNVIEESLPNGFALPSRGLVFDFTAVSGGRVVSAPLAIVLADGGEVGKKVTNRFERH